MELEEFERLNPIICGKCENFDSKKQAIKVQGEYLKTHTFILDSLSKSQAHILRLRYGLDGGEILTLGQVGNKVGLTHQRVNQIEERAFEKLRHPTRIKWLMEYTDETFDRDLLDEFINFRSLIRKDIVRTISEDTLQVVKNISIDDLEIGASHVHSIKYKLKIGGIKTCADLIRYLQVNYNLQDLGLGDSSYNKLIDSIYYLIEDGIVKIVSEEDLSKYLEHRAGDIKKENKRVQKHRQEEKELKERLASSDENLGQILIRDFRFTNRTFTCLQHERIYTFDDLVKYYSTYGSFSRIRNLGPQCEQEIHDKMKELRIDLYALLLQSRQKVLNSANENPENVLIENLEFSDRAYNALKRANIHTLKDIITYFNEHKNLCTISKLGRGSETEILNKLRSLGIILGNKSKEDLNNSDLEV